MTRRYRNISDVYADHNQSRQREQDAIRQMAEDERLAAQERDLADARRIVEEHRERTFKPDPDALHKPQEFTPQSRSPRRGPTQEELAHEEKRRAFARMGLTMRTHAVSHNQDPEEEPPAERERRARLGIPKKVQGFGRPPWA